VKIVEEVYEEEENLIEIRIVKKIIPRRFHKYFKMFEKRNSEIIPIRMSEL